VSNYKEWFIKLKDMRNQRPIDDDTGVANILSAGTPDEVSITDRFGVALANPLAFANGELRFYTAKSVTTVDVSLLTATGYAVYATGMSSDEHSIFICRENRDQLLVIPFLFNAGGTEVDTGFDLPANCLVTDAYVRVTTIDATETVDVGILSGEAGGDLDGFLDLVDLGTAGHVNTYPVVTNGGTIDYHATNGSIYGVFLSQLIAGADAVATVGGFQRRYYRTDGVAKSISYTPTTSDTAKGFIYIRFSNLV
jgi:hypothetical protein